MGILVEGQGRENELSAETDTPPGGFQRSNSQFRNRITADDSSGFKAEAGRYHLYVAYNCPRAHRTLIFRALKKRERAITVAYALPGIREHGWLFGSDPSFSQSSICTCFIPRLHRPLEPPSTRIGGFPAPTPDAFFVLEPPQRT